VPAEPGYGYFGISWYEYREAARFVYYRWEDFIILRPGSIAGHIAHYRTYHKLHALIRDYTEDSIAMARKQRSAIH